MSSNDARQFKTLVEPHLDALFGVAYRLARNRADAEDLVQETCIRAYLGIGDLDESQSARAWLLRVMHNRFVDITRHARRAPITPSGNGEDFAACMESNPEERTEATQRGEQLNRAWLKLDCGHRALLALRAEGYTLSEIAESLGLTTDVVNARLYRARQSFARYLTEEQVLVSGLRMEIAK